jgi:uncharacterized membrane protein
MTKFFLVYLVSIIAMVVIDLIWIGGVAKPFYQKHLGYLFAEKFKIVPIVLFYLIYIFGLMVFVVSPALSGTVPLGRSVMMAALLGLVAYATYDLTSHGLIKDWPWIVTVVDMVWGTFLTALIAAIAISVGRLIS